MLLTLAPSSIGVGTIDAGVVLVFFGLIAMAMLSAAGETAVASVRRARLQLLQEEGSTSARSLQRLLENSAGFVATSQLMIRLTLIAGTTLLIAAFAQPLGEALQSPAAAFGLLTALVVIIALVLVEQIARGVGVRNAEAIALSFAPIARATVLLLWPLVKLLNACGSVVSGQAPRETAGSVTEAGIKLQVDVAEEEGVLEEDEGEMIRSIFEFGDTAAREIMVPRIDVEAAETTDSLAAVIDLAVAAGHSRIPIYEETVDRIVGIFYIKDALRFMREGRLDVKVGEVMRPAYFVPETKKVDELLHEMQSRRVHVAVVVDEYGGTAGLVTIEDILEEIVGEIQDEFDAEEAPIQQISEDEAVIDALMTLDDVNDVLSLNLEAEDVDTLGGFVYAKLGRVPEQGDEITFDGARLVVEAVEGNRVNKVRIIKHRPAQPDDEAAASAARRPAEEG